MRMETRVSGITFANKGEIFTRLKPKGILSLVPDPDNKFDKNRLAVTVMMPHPEGGEPIKVGFLPATERGSPELEKANIALQREVHDAAESGKPIFCVVLKYSYSPDRNKTFNEDHNGRLASICIYVTDDIEDARAYYRSFKEKQEAMYGSRNTKASDDSDPETKVTSTHYVTGGRKYRRLTDLLNVYEPDGKEGSEYLDKWKFAQAAAGFDFTAATNLDEDGNSLDAKNSEVLYEGYVKAFVQTGVDGTAMHSAIEDWLEGNHEAPVPQGFLNWWRKYEPEVIAIEQTVYDNDVMVAGTFDLLCKIGDKVVAVDWKSSKAVRKKHKIQAGWYATHAEADEGWVVCFGGTQKQGFGLSKLDDETCLKKADQVDLMVQLQELEK